MKTLIYHTTSLRQQPAD